MSVAGWDALFDDAGPPHGFRTRCWRSASSGLHVLLADVPGPVAHSFLTLRTEAHDHRGLPHCLEHLCFLGTQKYPHKGLLDVVAQSILSTGTNAWTAQDNTTYTLSAASKTGLLNVIPLFMDHVFFPLLHSSHYLQEVYAVNGAGEDVGVVFSEMQGMENKLTTLANLKLAELLHPNSSYSVETGGKMQSLRDERTMNMEAVRAYHQRYYRPNNALLCIAGQDIDPTQLLTVLGDVDARLRALRDDSLPRPFTTLLAPLPPQGSTEEIAFPAESEEFGRVDLGWRFDQTLSALRERVTQVSLLVDYLCEGIASPMHHHLVDQAEPLCRAVDSAFDLYLQPAVSFVFSGCPTRSIHQVRAKALDVLAAQATPEHFDAARMRMIIEKAIWDERSEIEQEPSEHVQENAALAFLYFPDMGAAPSLMWEEGRLMRALLDKPAAFWTALLTDTFLRAPSVCCVSRPSATLHAELVAKDRAQMQERVQLHGEQGLQQLQAKLDAATEEIEASEAPQELLDKFIAGLNVDLSKISLHVLHTWRSAPDGQQPASSLLPPWMQAHLQHMNGLQCSLMEIDHYARTAFVDLAVYVMGVDKLSRRDKLCLPLFCEMMFKLSVGDRTHYEVAATLDADLVSYSAGVGITPASTFGCGAYPSVLNFFVRAKAANYEKAVEHVRQNFLEADFGDAERIALAVNILKSRVAEYERNPNHVMRQQMQELLFESDSVSRAMNFATQKRFLAKHDKNPAKFRKRLLKCVRRLRQKAFLGNMIVQVVADVSALHLPRKPWRKWRVQGSVPESLSGVRPTNLFLKAKAFKGKDPVIVPMPIDGGHVLEAWEGPSFAHDVAEFAAVSVLTELVSMQEGPMWNAIRGKGLAYGAYVYLNAEIGYLVLQISECSSVSDMHEALRAARAALDEVDHDLVANALDTAKSIALGHLVEALGSHQMVAEKRLLSVFKGWTSEQLIRQYSQVTEQAVLKAWKRWFLRKRKRSQVVMVQSQGADGREGDGADSSSSGDDA